MVVGWVGEGTCRGERREREGERGRERREEDGASFVLALDLLFSCFVFVRRVSCLPSLVLLAHLSFLDTVGF